MLVKTHDNASTESAGTEIKEGTTLAQKAGCTAAPNFALFEPSHPFAPFDLAVGLPI